MRIGLAALISMTVTSTACAQSTFTVISTGDEVVGISRNGQYVIGRTSAFPATYWIWSSASGKQNLPIEAQWVANNGTVVGLANGLAYCPLNGTPVSTGAQGSLNASGCSDDGSVIVGGIQVDVNKTDAFRWTSQTGLQIIATGAEAFACSSDGSVVVGTYNGKPFKWTTLAGLSFVSPFQGWFDGVTSDGSIATGFVTDPFAQEAVLKVLRGSTLHPLVAGSFTPSMHPTH